MISPAFSSKKKVCSVEMACFTALQQFDGEVRYPPGGGSDERVSSALKSDEVHEGGPEF
ncbi:hypothetical protein PVAP13_1NG346738 [Panicum virgatum]|uniref:Uncharacterized protein n=1 Tax=Panicum virgatum TaxID=38727 RepID=A0A8T0WXG0_PANVG|nr:hypothetical protein PVAP13_1NG346738 [Panicum virgatum]